MKLEDVMLSEMHQLQKDKYCNDTTYVRYLEQTNSQRQEVEWRFPETG